MRRSHFAFLASGFLLGLMVAGGIQLVRQQFDQHQPPARFAIAPVALTAPAPVERPWGTEAPRLLPYDKNWRLNDDARNPSDPPPPAHYWSKGRINGIPYYIVPLASPN